MRVAENLLPWRIAISTGAEAHPRLDRHPGRWVHWDIIRLVNRRDLQELSNIRLKEASALLELGLFDGAYYLAGYALECAIKACIAKGTQRHDFPDKKRVDSSHSHNLRDLIRVAGLDDARLEQASEDAEFSKNWDVVEQWSEQSRYRRHRPESAQELLAAISDRRHGVISWIKLHW